MSRSLTVTAQNILPEFVRLAMNGRKDLVFKTTEVAIEKLSTMYQEAWMRAASGAALPGLPFVVNSKQYHRTIERRQLGPTSWEIYTSYTTKTGMSVTELLEKGHGLIDLKPGLLSGPKSRAGKNGRYNIVSFRHGVPGSDPYRNNPMPLSVYKNFTSQVKAAEQQKATGAASVGGKSTVQQSSGTPGGRSYTWGSRFDRASKLGQETKTIKKKGKVIGEYTHKSGRYAGMVAMQSSTQNARHSHYLTFRVVSSHSDPMSWIVPEQPPWPVRQAVKDYMKPFAEEMLQRALEEDMK